MSPKYSEMEYICSLFLSAEYVVSLANMVIMMMMMINLRVCCEDIAMSLKNCAIRAVFRRRPPQALLVVKIDLSPLCSAWPGAALASANKAAPADSSVFYQITHVR